MATAERTATGLGDPIVTHRARAATRGQWTYRHPIALLASVDRNEYLVEIARKRRVIHVGCATEGETEGQFHAGRLLFAQLEAVGGQDQFPHRLRRISITERPTVAEYLREVVLEMNDVVAHQVVEGSLKVR